MSNILTLTLALIGGLMMLVYQIVKVSKDKSRSILAITCTVNFMIAVSGLIIFHLVNVGEVMIFGCIYFFLLIMSTVNFLLKCRKTISNGNEKRELVYNTINCTLVALFSNIVSFLASYFDYKSDIFQDIVCLVYMIISYNIIINVQKLICKFYEKDSKVQKNADTRNY